jgi:hypothetical protein
VADDLKEQISAGFIDGQITQFVALCGAPHNATYVECSFMLRVCRLGSLLTLSPTDLFT